MDFKQFEDRHTDNVCRVTKQYAGHFAFPLPPLDVQKEIVAEIEGYQRVIDGARKLIERMERKIAAAIARAVDQINLTVVSDWPRFGQSPHAYPLSEIHSRRGGSVWSWWTGEESNR